METSTAEGSPKFGSRQADFRGTKILDYSSPSLSLKLDYFSSSVGVDLGNVRPITQVRLRRSGTRITPKTLELYTSQTGFDASWTKVDGTTSTDKDGTLIRLGEGVSGRYLKIHSTWDERDSYGQPVDRATLAGTPADLIEVWSILDGQTTAWTYDSLGNRLSEDRYRGDHSTITTSYYPTSNQIKTNGAWEFNYDPNGNLTERGTMGTWDSSTEQFTWDSANGEIWTYTYDLRNRLNSVSHGKAGTASLAPVASYTYDIRDLRIATQRAGKTNFYQYDLGGDLIWEETGTDSIAYIQALGQTWAEVRTSGSDTSTYFHHTDHLGSTELITDSTGKVVWSGNFEAFGAVSRNIGQGGFTPSFTGKQLDPDTGLYYFNARWYDPELGRFISEDPARDDINWYAYCANNPMNFVDPTGLDDKATAPRAAYHDNNYQELGYPSPYYRIAFDTPGQANETGDVTRQIKVGESLNIGLANFAAADPFLDSLKDSPFSSFYVTTTKDDTMLRLVAGQDITLKIHSFFSDDKRNVTYMDFIFQPKQGSQELWRYRGGDLSLGAAALIGETGVQFSRGIAGYSFVSDRGRGFKQLFMVGNDKMAGYSLGAGVTSSFTWGSAKLDPRLTLDQVLSSFAKDTTTQAGFSILFGGYARSRGKTWESQSISGSVGAELTKAWLPISATMTEGPMEPLGRMFNVVSP